MDISTVWSKSDIHTWIYPWIWVGPIHIKVEVGPFLHFEATIR